MAQLATVNMRGEQTVQGVVVVYYLYIFLKDP
jgi:hypothetical protein